MEERKVEFIVKSDGSGPENIDKPLDPAQNPQLGMVKDVLPVYVAPSTSSGGSSQPSSEQS